MLLFPYQERTLVSSFTKEEVIGKIASRTRILKEETLVDSPLFNGRFTNGQFRLSLFVRSSQNYLPLVNGKVEDTSLGSILFLELRLFPAAKLYLIFSSLMALLIGLTFLLIAGSILAGVVAFGLGVANYLLMAVNFRRKAKETISALEAILEP